MSTSLMLVVTVRFGLIADDSKRIKTKIMPNTHRRRRRDSTVELRLVGVGGVNTIRN